MIDFPEEFADLFNEQHRYIAFYGGRSSSKSHQVAGAMVLRGWQKPMTILFTREVQRSLRDSVYQLLINKIAAFDLQQEYTILNNEIRGKNGSKFIFAGLRSSPESIKSAEDIDIACIEEANYISEKSRKMLWPTIRKKGSQIISVWNPDSENDPIDKYFRGSEKLPPRSLIKRVSWKDNPFFDDTELRAEMNYDYERDPELAEHVWGGEYLTISKASVFKRWTVKEFDSPTAKDRNFDFRIGLDFGYSVDPCAAVRIFTDEDPKSRNLYIDYDCASRGIEIDDTPEFIEQHIPNCRRWPLIGDSSRPEILSYLRRSKFKARGSVKGAGSVMRGIKWLQSRDIIIHPRCKDTIQEFKSYRYVTDKATGKIMPILEDKNNHLIDALRYACEKMINNAKLERFL